MIDETINIKVGFVMGFYGIVCFVLGMLVYGWLIKG